MRLCPEIMDPVDQLSQQPALVRFCHFLRLRVLLTFFVVSRADHLPAAKSCRLDALLVSSSHAADTAARVGQSSVSVVALAGWKKKKKKLKRATSSATIHEADENAVTGLT